MKNTAPTKPETAKAETTSDNAKPLSADERRKLFVAYDAARAAVDAAETALANAKANCEASVEAIATKVGRGPFDWKGRVLVASKAGRTGTWHMRAPGDLDVVKI